MSWTMLFFLVFAITYSVSYALAPTAEDRHTVNVNAIFWAVLWIMGSMPFIGILGCILAAIALFLVCGLVVGIRLACPVIWAALNKKRGFGYLGDGSTGDTLAVCAGFAVVSVATILLSIQFG